MFGLFGGKKQQSAVVIDIGSTSIGGAFVVYPKDGTPLMPYAVRENIDFPDEKRSELCMLRALETVMNALHTEGRPALARASGIHHVDRVFISLDAPWQETKVEAKIIGDGKAFVFSRDMLMNAVKERTPLPEGKRELQIEVVATLLNGYQTNDPYGKRAERAEILMLSSSMDGDTMNLIGRSAKRFNAKQGVLISPLQSLAHAVLRAQYPHDKDFLLMLVSDEATNILFANRGIIMDATSISIGLAHLAEARASEMRILHVNEASVPQEPTLAPDSAPVPAAESTDTAAWTSEIAAALREFASRHALPRIVFLVTNDGSADALKRFLDTPEMHALWLSDESLTVIPVISKLLSSFIHHQGTADADVMLDLVTLFAQLKLKQA